MTAIDEEARARAKRRARLRAALARETLRWHWISAAVCLAGMLMFAVTGVTLNHAASIEGSARTTSGSAAAPAEMLPSLRKAAEARGPLPAATRAWLRDELGTKVPPDAAVEWSAGEAYVSLPRPGADAWVSIDTVGGEVVFERTNRGAVAFLNDLHKGRVTGRAWRWFIDIFAAGTVVFCVTGLILLQLHARMRPMTWPALGLGVAAPLLVVIFLV